MGQTILRCTDGLNNESFVEELRNFYTASDCGRIYLKETGEELPERNRTKDYLGITYKGKQYLKHRVLYALWHGPYYSHIDHIDRDTFNNSKDNLRLCSQGLNVANASMRSDNTTGYIGVIWHKASNKWQAQTMLKGKRVHIGLFSDIKEAALAYNHKLTEMFGHQCTFNNVFEDHPDAATETSATNIGKTSVAL